MLFWMLKESIATITHWVSFGSAGDELAYKRNNHKYKYYIVLLLLLLSLLGLSATMHQHIAVAIATISTTGVRNIRLLKLWNTQHIHSHEDHSNVQTEGKRDYLLQTFIYSIFKIQNTTAHCGWYSFPIWIFGCISSSILVFGYVINMLFLGVIPFKFHRYR